MELSLKLITNIFLYPDLFTSKAAADKKNWVPNVVISNVQRLLFVSICMNGNLPIFVLFIVLYVEDINNFVNLPFSISLFKKKLFLNLS